jgi:hypothetical protein
LLEDHPINIGGIMSRPSKVSNNDQNHRQLQKRLKLIEPFSRSAIDSGYRCMTPKAVKLSKQGDTIYGDSEFVPLVPVPSKIKLKCASLKRRGIEMPFDDLNR